MDYSTVTAVCTAKLAKENADKIAKISNSLVAQADVDQLRQAQFQAYTQLSRRIEEGGGSSTTTGYTKAETDSKFATKTALNQLQQEAQTTGAALTNSVNTLTSKMTQAQADVNTRFDTLQNNLTQTLTELNQTNTRQDNSITTINSVIPSSATAANQLTDTETVKELVLAGAARGLSASADGAGFDSYAALVAGPWYNVGAETQPTKNDYAVVKKDATHSGNDVRYNYDGAVWVFYMEFSGGGFTPTTQQQLALDSGITQTKVTTYDKMVTQFTEQVTQLKEKDTSLEAAIASEVGTRETAVNQLTAAINTEELQRTEKYNELLGYIGTMTDLTTPDTTSLVNALNAVNTLVQMFKTDYYTTNTFTMQGQSTFGSTRYVMMCTGMGDKKTYFDLTTTYDVSRLSVSDEEYATFDFANKCFTYIKSTSDNNPHTVNILLDGTTVIGQAGLNFTSTKAMVPTNISYEHNDPRL